MELVELIIDILDVIASIIDSNRAAKKYINGTHGKYKDRCSDRKYHHPAND